MPEHLVLRINIGRTSTDLEIFNPGSRLVVATFSILTVLKSLSKDMADAFIVLMNENLIKQLNPIREIQISFPIFEYTKRGKHLKTKALTLSVENEERDKIRKMILELPLDIVWIAAKVSITYDKFRTL